MLTLRQVSQMVSVSTMPAMCFAVAPMVFFVFTPQAVLLGKIPVPEQVSNCTFGGPDGDELYITAGKSLYRIRLNTYG